MAASELLLQCPPGSFDAVYRDVSILAEGTEGLGEAAKRWSVQHCVAFPCGEDDPLLVCDVALQEDGRILDPRNSQAIRVDHLARTCMEREARDPAFPELEPHRFTLDGAVRRYLARMSPDANFAVYATGPAALAVRISSSKSKQTSLWGGEWLSRWEVRVEAGGDGAEVEGACEAAVHYFEDGNVQLRVSQPVVPATVAFQRGSVEGFAAAVVRRIEEGEAGVHRGLLESLEQLSRSTWKELRRKLPITGASFDWGKAHNYKLAHELAQKI